MLLSNDYYIVQLEYQSAVQGQQMAKSHEASMGAAERRVAERKRKVKEKKEAIARKARKAALADGTEQEMDRVRVTILCVLCCVVVDRISTYCSYFFLPGTVGTLLALRV